MEVTYTHCAGLDVHKKTVVACCLTPREGGGICKETRTFTTMTQELLALGDWLNSRGDLTHLDFLEEQIAVFDAQIAQHIQTQVLEVEVPAPSGEQDIPPCNNYSLAWEKAITLLDTIPGVGRQTAELLLAEIGCDMSRFKSEAHLAKWAKLCPGNHESAGKRYSGRTGQGNNWLRSGLIQAAHAAVKCKATYLKAVYQRLVKRRGKQKAIVAVAHRILKAAYQILSKQEPYRDLGANYLDSRSPDKVLNRLCHRIEQLGYQVSLKPSCQGVG